MGKKREPSTYAVDADGRPFVRLKHSGIEMLVAMIDGITLTHFKGERELYIPAAEVRDWHKREHQRTGDERHLRAYKAVAEALRRLETGDRVEFLDG